MPDRNLTAPIAPGISSPWSAVAPYTPRVWIDDSGVVHWEGQVQASASALTQGVFSTVFANLAIPGSGQVFAPIFAPCSGALNTGGQAMIVPALVNSALGLAIIACGQTTAGPQLGIAVELPTLGSGLVVVSLTGFHYRVDS